MDSQKHVAITKSGKTIQQLADRLQYIIDRNVKDGKPERNQLPAVVSIRSHQNFKRRSRVKYYLLEFAMSGELGIQWEDGIVYVVEISAGAEIKPSKQ